MLDYCLGQISQSGIAGSKVKNSFMFLDIIIKLLVKGLYKLNHYPPPLFLDEETEREQMKCPSSQR